MPHADVPGAHCRATDVRVSAADSAWVYARVGLYSSQGQLMSDSDLVILNLTTHKVIGPTNVGFCGGGPTGSDPIGGYESVPAGVLAGLGLSPCEGTNSAATSVAAFAGTWRAHEMVLAITPAGTGHLIYPDLTACPSCSEGTAPAGTLDFTLTSVANGTGVSHVTASSDVKNWAVGHPVQVKRSAGSPGQLLNVQIGGKQLIAFCNNTSAGQCGA